MKPSSTVPSKLGLLFVVIVGLAVLGPSNQNVLGVETTVIKAAPEFTVLSKNPLNESAQASPAISQGQLFIRTERHLFAIGRK